jgi:hypothetical protein
MNWAWITSRFAVGGAFITIGTSPNSVIGSAPALVAPRGRPGMALQRLGRIEAFAVVAPFSRQTWRKRYQVGPSTGHCRQFPVSSLCFLGDRSAIVLPPITPRVL